MAKLENKQIIIFGNYRATKAPFCIEGLRMCGVNTRWWNVYKVEIQSTSIHASINTLVLLGWGGSHVNLKHKEIFAYVK